MLRLHVPEVLYVAVMLMPPVILIPLRLHRPILSVVTHRRTITTIATATIATVRPRRVSPMVAAAIVRRVAVRVVTARPVVAVVPLADVANCYKRF